MFIGISQQIFELKYAEKVVKQGAVVVHSVWEFTVFHISSYQSLLDKLQQLVFFDIATFFHIQHHYP